MFKKTLLAAALATATGAVFAGDITIAGGTAYKVGNEYLSAYTGTAGLEGDIAGAGLGIQYTSGIALGVNNTLKFEFAGGAISADVGLTLDKVTAFAVHADQAAIDTAIDTAVGLVADATGTTQAELDVSLAAAKAAALAAIKVFTDADVTVDAAAAIAAINAVTTVALDVVGKPKADIIALNTVISSNIVVTGHAPVASLVDFTADANGDYTSVLFKLTSATGAADVLIFNALAGVSGTSTATATFTKATIGTGNLTISMPEAKDDTGTVLSAPIAGAKILVTTADQFAVTATAVTDTIDVEQDRLFFSDAISDADSTAFVIDFTEDATIGLKIDSTTAVFEAEITGNLTGVDSVAYAETVLVGTDDSAAFDVDNLVAGVGISDATVVVTVDGETNLATRTLGVSMMITPTEADTEAFYLLGSSTAGANAFVWDLNGSEITFPYAPIGYDHITTNFELANSGTQEGEILLSAFGRDGASYTGSITQKAEAGSLVKVSGTDVYNALGLTAGSSISLTVTTTAPQNDIKVTGYSNLNSGGRMTLLSDAYEGKSDKANCVLTGTAVGDDLAITCN